MRQTPSQQLSSVANCFAAEFVLGWTGSVNCLACLIIRLIILEPTSPTLSTRLRIWRLGFESLAARQMRSSEAV
jgi:hypothetical protein